MFKGENFLQIPRVYRATEGGDTPLVPAIAENTYTEYNAWQPAKKFMEKAWQAVLR